MTDEKDLNQFDTTDLEDNVITEKIHLTAKESAGSAVKSQITDAIEKQRNRKNVPESEYLTQMRDPNNVVEFDDLHTYFFTDIGTVKAVDGVTYDVPQGSTVGV